ncbi:MAG: hypothetical protein U1E70_16620 [Acetobacteraceae bacterium]|nr:hypothetical protein [Pseudomonadota bacterium]
MARIGNESLLRFDTGISTVRRAEELPRLPDEGVAPAVESRPVQLLDALYDMPTFDDRLLAAAAPEITDRGVLDPGIYAAALRDGRDLLAALADRGPEGDGAVFAAARDVMDAAEDLRAILDTATRLLMRA